MTKHILTLACIVALTGCSALGIQKETRTMHDVSCSGFEKWEDCDTKAKRMCDKGYDVAKKDESLIAQKRMIYFYCK